MKQFTFKLLAKPAFDSKIKTDNIKNKERWIGYFLGPALVACVNGAVGGSYLNTFYTDVLKLSGVGAGVFLSIMPVISKIIDAVTNIIMGRIVDNTKSRQGKARPWILLSGPIMAITAFLMFAVPVSNITVTVIWVTCSYNLFFCISYTMYNLSNVITLPLSTRDNKKRDTLGMAQSMGINMVPGVILAVIFPAVILPYMGVDQSRWILIMGIISLFSILGTLLQYYFIRERVTEENSVEEHNNEGQAISIKDQIKGCLSSKYWIMIIIVMFTYYLCNAITLNAIHYYANWVVGTYNDGTLAILNVIGQAMLGPGIIIMWPLVKKFGKQKIFVVCSIIAVIGGVVGMLFAYNLTAALVALTIRSVGNLPTTYVTLSVLADALDHVEWKSGYRCDGFSSSIYSIIITVTSGLGLGLFNMGLGITGYVAPHADGTWVAQSETVQTFLTFGTFGIPAIGMIIISIIFAMFNLEKKLPEIHKEIRERRNAKGIAEDLDTQINTQ